MNERNEGSSSEGGHEWQPFSPRCVGRPVLLRASRCVSRSPDDMASPENRRCCTVRDLGRKPKRKKSAFFFLATSRADRQNSAFRMAPLLSRLCLLLSRLILSSSILVAKRGKGCGSRSRWPIKVQGFLQSCAVLVPAVKCRHFAPSQSLCFSLSFFSVLILGAELTLALTVPGLAPLPA